MIVVDSIAELRAALQPGRRAGRRLGLVPTMGAFHDGHLSLMRHAVRHCDDVVVSLFVNPIQFNDRADLAAYPRDPEADADQAEALGVDWLFAPTVSEMYPQGFATTVSVAGVSEPLEGAHRGAGHFQGVATVVCKLLNIVGPDVAYFGAKDAQQLAVIRRMVADLGIGAAIEGLPTVRAADGLALSSRNALLTPADRARAPALHRALQAVVGAVAAGERDPAVAIAAGHEQLRGAGAELEYLQLVDPATMVELPVLDRDALAVIAARFGAVRLIDNVLVPLGSAETPDPHPVATSIGAPTD
ncbi:MAG TPA: pantoate--beta-alanine ligase [Solirubrobacteraceae bacterium]|nr:pantoate--beta-alanine ligase [Solirubrobacteraceae bacterium]